MNIRILMFVSLIGFSCVMSGQKKYGQADYDRICDRYSTEIDRQSAKLRSLFKEIEIERAQIREHAAQIKEMEKEWANDIKNAKQAPIAVPILNHESNIEMVRPYLVEQLLPPRGWVKRKRNGKLVVYMNKDAYKRATETNFSGLDERIEAAINDKVASGVLGNNQDNQQKGQSQYSVCDKLEKDIESYNQQRKELTKRISDATTMFQKAASDPKLNDGPSQQKLRDTLTKVLLKDEIPKEVPPLTEKECKTCGELKSKSELIELLKLGK